MSVAAAAEQAQVRQKVEYPEADDHGKRLAVEFDGDVQGLQIMVTALRSTLTGMSGEDRKARDIKMPRTPAAGG